MEEEEQQNRPESCENGREVREAEEQRQQEESVLQFLDSMDGYLTLLDSLSSTLRQVMLTRSCLLSLVLCIYCNWFLDSMDGYLTLLDSLSSTLRQGWIDLASARHSMGVSRVTSVLFDLKLHSASTEQGGDSSLSGKCGSGEIEIDKRELQQSSSPQLRHRGASPHSELQKEYPAGSTTSPKAYQVQNERFKLLSVFGTLVSPKLHTAQLSFETALGTLVKTANMRSSMLSAFAQVQKQSQATTKMA